MRRVTFTRAVTLKVVYNYEATLEEGVTPRFHKVAFKKGESVDLYEWGWTEETTNFATDDPSLLARVVPGDSNYDVACILEVPYDCHDGEPAFEAKEEPFRVRTPKIKSRTPRLFFPADSGSPDDEDLVDSQPTAASMA
jgi:hypothetical protein